MARAQKTNKESGKEGELRMIDTSFDTAPTHDYGRLFGHEMTFFYFRIVSVSVDHLRCLLRARKA